MPLWFIMRLALQKSMRSMSPRDSLPIGGSPVKPESQLKQELDKAIDHYAMLKHPFYKLWSDGKLSQSILRDYAKQYYAHVLAFPTYVSAVHSQCNEVPVRQMLLENLIEEERGAENHPELWLRFAEGLGSSRADVRSANLLPSTTASVDVMRSLTRSNDYREGLAALYAYESQIPEVARTQRAGLEKFYGISDKRTFDFFSTHEAAYVVHQAIVLKILNDSCPDEESRQRVVRAAAAGAKALWTFLDGVQSAFVN